MLTSKASGLGMTLSRALAYTITRLVYQTKALTPGLNVHIKLMNQNMRIVGCKWG